MQWCSAGYAVYTVQPLLSPPLMHISTFIFLLSGFILKMDMNSEHSHCSRLHGTAAGAGAALGSASAAEPGKEEVRACEAEVFPARLL